MFPARKVIWLSAVYEELYSRKISDVTQAVSGHCRGYKRHAEWVATQGGRKEKEEETKTTGAQRGRGLRGLMLREGERLEKPTVCCYGNPLHYSITLLHSLNSGIVKHSVVLGRYYNSAYVRRLLTSWLCTAWYSGTLLRGAIYVCPLIAPISLILMY